MLQHSTIRHSRLAAFRCSAASLTLALGLGVVIAILLASRSDDSAALRQIVSDDPEQREQGWQWLTAIRNDEATSRAAIRIEQINEAIAEVEDTATLMTAADHLRIVSLWDWEFQPTELVLRETALRARGGDADRKLAARMMARGPLEISETKVMPIFHDMLHAEDTAVREYATTVAFGWIGPKRRELLVMLPLRDDEETRRLLRVGVYWAREQDRREIPPRVWERFDAEEAMQLLQHRVTDEDGMTYAAALLAEHSLPREDAAELARKWIVDYNNDRKRAGALLAVLLGVHEELLEDAYHAATDGQVRTTMRVALHALGRDVGNGDAVEFTHRVIHLEDGHINPDVLLCLLAAGNERAPKYLASTPRTLTGEAIRPRTLLIERFIPYWDVNEAIRFSGAEPLVAYYESLHVLWMLTHRHQEFDPDSRTWLSVARNTGER